MNARIKGLSFGWGIWLRESSIKERGHDGEIARSLVFLLCLYDVSSTAAAAASSSSTSSFCVLLSPLSGIKDFCL